MNVCIKWLECGELIVKQAFFWFSVKTWLNFALCCSNSPCCLRMLTLNKAQQFHQWPWGRVGCSEGCRASCTRSVALSEPENCNFIANSWKMGFICLNLSWWHSLPWGPLGFSNGHFNLTGKESCSLELVQSCCLGVNVPEGRFWCLFQL